MKWLKIFAWFGDEDNDEDDTDEDVRLAGEKLREVEVKLDEDLAKVPTLARAVASARRVHYRVDKFTGEISRSFGRLNRG